MPRYRTQVSYDGTAFHGWQVQPGQRTVQGVFKEILERLGEDSSPYGAGRTDAGVHALANTAHMDMDRTWEPAELERALNSLAPPDMAFAGVGRRDSDFHARFSASARRYAYVFSSEATAFNQRRALHPGTLPSAEWVRRELADMGAHRDFASFCLSGSDTATTLCRIRDSRWWTFPKGAMLTVQSDRFLYGMMRALVGTLLEGHIRRQSGYLDRVLQQRSRAQAGPTAPPWGLYFVRAEYPGDGPEDPSWPGRLAALAGISESGDRGYLERTES